MQKAVQKAISDASIDQFSDVAVIYTSTKCANKCIFLTFSQRSFHILFVNTFSFYNNFFQKSYFVAIGCGLYALPPICTLEVWNFKFKGCEIETEEILQKICIN